MAADDVAGNSDDAVIRNFREIAGAQNIFEMRADQGHWVRAGGELEAFEVGAEAFDGAHGK